MNIALIVLLALLVGWAVWRAYQRARKGGGCCGERAQDVARVSVQDRNKAHYPYTVRLKIGGMTCQNCARRVENALNSLDGVWAAVCLDERAAIVRCKQAPDEAALRQAVRGAGYVVMEE